MKLQNYFLSTFIGMVLGGGIMFFLNSKEKQSTIDSTTFDDNEDISVINSEKFQKFFAQNTVGKDEAVKWIKIFKFRSQDLSNPRQRNIESDIERRGGFQGDTTPTRYFTIPIQYIIDAFNFWNQDAGFTTRLRLINPANGYSGFRIYPMVYPNMQTHQNRRRMNLLLVPINRDGTELVDYKNKSGENKSAIFMYPLNNLGTIYNEIGQCPPSCQPPGTLDNLSGN